jgi:hypothetical protein
MGMNGKEERDLVAKMNVFGWIVFPIPAALSFVFLSSKVSLGIVLGGLLVQINLALLHRFTRRALRPGVRVNPVAVLIKYNLCFLATVVVILALTVGGLVDGMGLLAGLGLFVLNVFTIVAFTAVKIVYKTFMKEAV